MSSKVGKVESGEPDRPAAVQRPQLDVTGATKALTVGPKEVLVVTFPASYADDVDFPGFMEDLRRRLLDVLGPNRFLVIMADGVTIAAAKADAQSIVDGSGSGGA